ncbi:putative ribonuclease H-like domain-containing protein [Tanacetum coccineum]
MVSRAVLMKSGQVSLNIAKQVNTAHPKIIMNSAKPMTNLSKIEHSTGPKEVVNAARPKAVVIVVKGNNVNVVKASACWTMKRLMDDMLPLEETPKEGKSQAELTDESHVLLKAPRKNNMYSVDLKNIIPKGGLTCLFAKATSYESELWHRRLRRINFKTMNKLVKGNLVRGLPLKLFENNQTCVTCQKGKQHRASCKSKTVNSISQPLHMLHMDLFGPTFVKSLMKKMYSLVVTDDYSRFSWVFFLATKDETSGILKSFITGVENLIDQRVKNGIGVNASDSKLMLLGINLLLLGKVNAARHKLTAAVESMDCLPNATIFEELTKMGFKKLSQKLTFYKAFFSPQWKFLIYTILQCLSAKTTAWNEFSSSMDSAIICLATNQKFNFSKYIFESMVKNLDNADEVVNEEMDDSLERAATTATSLDAEQDRGNINKTQSKATPNEPSFLGTSSGGGPSLGDYKIETESQEVREERRAKNSQAQKILQEITLVDETQGRYGDDIMFDVSDLAGEEVFVAKQGAPDSKKDDVAQVITIATIVSTASIILVSVASITDVEITLAQVLAELKSAKPTTATSKRPRAKGLVIYKQDQAPTPIIEADYLLAERLQTREQEELTIEERTKLFQQLLKKRIKHFAAKRVEEKRNRPPTKAQQRSIMCTYLKNMEGWKPKDLKSKTFANIQELFDKAMKRVNTFVDYRIELVEGSSKKVDIEIAQESSSKRAGDELEQESIKKQKVDEDKERAELKSIMEVIPDEEEVAIDVVPLATKTPSILDWKIHKEGKKSYYQIIRADRSSKMYLVFSHMLKIFDREDFETLYKLVKAKYGSTRPMED